MGSKSSGQIPDNRRWRPGSPLSQHRGLYSRAASSIDGTLPDLAKPLTEEEKKRFREILSSDELFDEWVEKAVSGRRKHAGRATRARSTSR